MGKLSKYTATGLVSTTQAIFRELTGNHLGSKSRKSLFYTGDFNLEETRLVPEAAKFPEADTLILESTYFGEDYIPQKETEKKFIESIWNTLEIESTALLPVFAIGRIQEILMLLNTHGIRAYVDSMGRDMYKIGVDAYASAKGELFTF